MIRGKGEFLRQDIITALTATAGDVDAAFTELIRPPPALPSSSPPRNLDYEDGILHENTF